MKINLTTNLLDENKNPIKKDKETDIIVKDVLINSLISMVNGDEKLDGANKYEYYKLFKKIDEQEKELEIEAEEIVKIKERVGKVYNVLIVGQVYDILEGK